MQLHGKAYTHLQIPISTKNYGENLDPEDLKRAAVILYLSEGWILTEISIVQLCSVLLHVLPPSGFHRVQTKVKSEKEVPGVSLSEGDREEHGGDCTTCFSVSGFLQKEVWQCVMPLKCCLEMR